MALQVLTDSTNFTIQSFTEHINNSDIHVTADEKAVWSEKEVFMVTLQWDESDLENPKWIPDKTFNEIIDAYNSGKYVYCKTTDGMTDNILSLILVDPNYSVYFQCIDHTGARMTIICNSIDEWTDEINDFLPHSDSSNAGQILMVDSNGIPQWTTITNAEGVAY